MCGEEGRVKARERSLGKVSVVQMAVAAESHEVWPVETLPYAEGIFVRIFSIGSLHGVSLDPGCKLRVA